MYKTKEEIEKEFRKDLESKKEDIPENTCPNIDKLIKEHSKLLEDLSYLERNARNYESAEELVKDFPNTWNDDVESIAEDLRKDNEILRNLGKFWYEEYKNIINKIHQIRRDDLEEVKKIIKEKGLHLGYGNDILDKLDNLNK